MRRSQDGLRGQRHGPTCARIIVLRDYLTFRSDSLVSNAHPCVLQRFRWRAGLSAGTRRGGRRVSVEDGTATVPMFAASVWSDRQGSRSCCRSAISMQSGGRAVSASHGVAPARQVRQMVLCGA